MGSMQDVSGRGTMYLTHRNRTGWVLRNHWEPKDVRVPLNRGASNSVFCFVPYGQSGGYGGRYVSAVLFGCIPVFFEHSDTCARTWPLAGLPDFDLQSCSLKTTPAGILTLHERLAAIPPQDIRRMQVSGGRGWGLD